ncbi:MAG: hypothetical protein KatS3mg023_1760 [Armatimonadota bacterium]|nr:MAG: hypothetical protein KatS3mg023_1760 [Armatimonadota bacterium]
MRVSGGEMLQDLVGALWVIAVLVVFLGLPYGLPEVSVSVLEKIYALCLMAGVVWLVRRFTSSERVVQGAKRRD